ncbi:hypothetical protein [Maribacter cobaltidurans]|uniref:Uncharacterized protein n=1 Tax=Maribacter cobaltidurans TaxID=1178778 RepID=A0A223V5I7_9FLAO|nr:hypothetical protein [Maribacter cobaltidurans]ASV30109.1 hypothetical protein CJ263_07650 [Maribacter cobaltidurans]GGD75781.1 hypothetical protein GCM10011412_11880 [Maribacter cobaltidurans]
MIDLDENKKEIRGFITNSISRFKSENEEPNSIGIYCCPWSGWITTNFNINKTIEETENNCPDFEFVEYDFLELSEWQDEYETDNPQFKLNDSINIHDHDLGDKNFNQLIFDYLKPLVIDLKESYEFDFLLQMLDSNLAEKI